MTEPNDQQASESEAIWRMYLVEGMEDMIDMRHLYRRLPSNPGHSRCKNCLAPFSGLGGSVVRFLYNKRRSSLNPHFCNACEEFAKDHAGGAEVELTMLFADIRGSTALAETMSATAFSKVINRFYTVSTNILCEADGFIDKLAGDEVTAFFFPGLAGADHVRSAVEAAQALLKATNHGSGQSPWAPVGVGIHVGVAYVGTVGGQDGMIDLTALGDDVNVAARLASKAAQGEIVVSEAVIEAAHITNEDLETRRLDLKGKSEPMNVRVIQVNSTI